MNKVRFFNSSPVQINVNPLGFLTSILLQKIEIIEKGTFWRPLKSSKKSQKMSFLNSVTLPKTVKGDVLVLLISILLSNIEANEGR